MENKIKSHVLEPKHGVIWPPDLDLPCVLKLLKPKPNKTTSVILHQKFQKEQIFPCVCIFHQSWGHSIKMNNVWVEGLVKKCIWKLPPRFHLPEKLSGQSYHLPLELRVPSGSHRAHQQGWEWVSQPWLLIHYQFFLLSLLCYRKKATTLEKCW